MAQFCAAATGPPGRLAWSIIPPPLTIAASLAGALLMAMLLNGFTILSIPYYYSDAVLSMILIAAIAVFSPQTLIWLNNSVRLFGSRPRPASGE